MALDIMTLAEFQAATSHWYQMRSSGHTRLRAIDTALRNYEATPGHDLIERIKKLNGIMNATEAYVNDKETTGTLKSTRDRRSDKVNQAQVLLDQATAKREYLAAVLGIERNFPAFFGHGGTREDQTAEEHLRGIISSAAKLKDYIGSSGVGKQIDMTYWSEAIDPLHRHWGNPSNSKVFQSWMRRRWEGEAPTTTLGFFRWMESIGDRRLVLEILDNNEMLCTRYQDSVGRGEFRIPIHEHRLKRMNGQDELVNWGTDTYNTNFGGDGWCIFVMDLAGNLYANNHDNTKGFFHSAFMGGQPVMAAGELWARNGVLYIMTDKSGHYKPGFQHLVAGATQLRDNGLDISQLQIWARHISGGMAPKVGGLWYMSIDATGFIQSQNTAQSMLYDFGYGAGGVRNTFVGGLQANHLRSINATPEHLGSKETFRGGTCGARAG